MNANLFVSNKGCNDFLSVYGLSSTFLLVSFFSGLFITENVKTYIKVCRIE